MKGSKARWGEREARSGGATRFVISVLGVFGLAVTFFLAFSPADQASAQTPQGMRTICVNGETMRVPEANLGQFNGYTNGPCQENGCGPASVSFRNGCEDEDEDEGRTSDERDEDERDERDERDEDEKKKDDEHDEDDVQKVIIIRQAAPPPVILTQPAPPVVQQQPVVVERVVVVESQGGGTTSSPAPVTRISAPSSGDGGLADPNYVAASTGASVAQALGIVVGSLGVVGVYSYFVRRAHRR